MDHVECCAIAAPGGALEGLGPLAAQVLSLGLAWTSLHCSGMCGPLIAGLRFGLRGTALHPTRAVLDLFAYQTGRAMVYAILGAAAGTLGLAASQVLQRWAPAMTLIAASGFAISALGRLRGASVSSGSHSRLARWSASINRLWAEHPLRRAMALGAVLAFMPCMLLFWVLSLAAASGSPWSGAALTVLLVVLTVPVLLAAAILPTLVGRWRRFCSPWVGPTAMLASAAWLLLIGLAGFEIIPHAHLRMGSYVIMFW
jgi:uncharacterized protein